MKRYIMLLIALGSFVFVQAQPDPIKVVFDLTSGDENTQKSALRHLKLMKESYPDSQFELVVYGKALPMLLKKDSPFAESVMAFEGDDRATIKVCEGTMKRYEVSKDQLFSAVQTVPDAIMEIARKQSEGWGYIKESHN